VPKQILPIQYFEGGYNSAASPRDVEDNQLTEADNAETSVKGAVKCLGEWDIFLNNSDGDDGNATLLDGISVNAGYGISMFQVEDELDPSGTIIADPGGYYLAVYDPSAGDPKLLVYNEPQETAETNVLSQAVLDIEEEVASSPEDSTVQFLNADGLRIYDSQYQFKPHKLHILPKGRHYFQSDETTAIDLELSQNTWNMDFQFVRPPNASHCVVVKDNTPTGTTSPSPLSSSAGVGLVLRTDEQIGTALNPIGWGSDANTSKKYFFYASFVYDGNQESIAVKMNNSAIELGGQSTSDNDISFIPYVKPGANAGSWNLRITGVRIYYRDEELNRDTKYLIGDFPITSSDGLGVGQDMEIAGVTEYFALAGDKSAYSSYNASTLFPLGLNTKIGVYHKSPPTIFIHSVMSGIRSNTVSTECYYKTGVIVNRKLYVGNIKQKTVDSSEEETLYGDRMLKSVVNRFDVLPDTEFIDVSIKDGEDIIKLAAFNNRLFQFKERTLYVIVVSGSEEYLEAKYDYMGILHPEAVVTTEVGIVWANSIGMWIYTGEGRPKSMIDGKIDPDEWADFVTDNTILGYDPIQKQVIVISDCSNVATQDETSGTPDMYIHNMITGSWNLGVDKLGDGTNASMSNIVNYTDVDGDVHTVTFYGGGNIVEWVSSKKYTANNSATPTIKPFKMTTKEFTGGSPHLRKKLYKLYITYRGNMASNHPAVKLTTVGPDDSGTITLDAVTDFVDAGEDWTSAEFVPNESDLDSVKNAYSVQVSIEGAAVNQDFEINDMSAVFRPKGVK
tara:strand:+ start:1364 stop:3727 length:2364 start_codon:yes stop_codon:yes gene_type:complete